MKTSPLTAFASGFVSNDDLAVQRAVFLVWLGLSLVAAASSASNRVLEDEGAYVQLTFRLRGRRKAASKSRHFS